MSEKEIFYIGKFSESTEELNDGVMTKEAVMFSAGTHRGTEYTKADLETLAKSFDPAQEIPVQLDHSDSARDTVGYIESVTVKGDNLMGTLKILDEYAQGRINKGLMKKLSIGFYLKETEEGFKPSALREVSLVAFPQVKGAQLFSENGYVTNFEQEEGKDMTQEKHIDLAELKKQLKDELDQEMQDKFQALENKVATLEDVEVKYNESQITSKIEKFSADNKIVPAQNDALKSLLASFSKEQMEAFEQFMSNSQKVDFSEQSEFENPDDKDKADKRTKEQIEFDEFYEAHTKNFGSKL